MILDEMRLEWGNKERREMLITFEELSKSCEEWRIEGEEMCGMRER